MEPFLPQPQPSSGLNDASVSNLHLCRGCWPWDLPSLWEVPSGEREGGARKHSPQPRSSASGEQSRDARLAPLLLLKATAEHSGRRRTRGRGRVDSPAHHRRVTDDSPNKEGARSLELPGPARIPPLTLKRHCKLSKATRHPGPQSGEWVQSHLPHKLASRKVQGGGHSQKVHSRAGSQI